MDMCKKPVEHCVRLDADKTVFDHSAGGMWLTISCHDWTYRKWRVRLSFETTGTNTARFFGTSQKTEPEAGPIMRVEMPLEARPCRFGGVRWFWVCPNCFSLRKHLYFHTGNGCYYCRECLKLTYRTQNDNYHRPTGRKQLRSLFWWMDREYTYGEIAERKYTNRYERRKRFKARRGVKVRQAQREY